MTDQELVDEFSKTMTAKYGPSVKLIEELLRRFEEAKGEK